MKKMSMKIKNCPNCGSNNIAKVKILLPRKLRKYYIECDSCHWCGENCITRRGAIRKWNKQIAWNERKGYDI